MTEKKSIMRYAGQDVEVLTVVAGRKVPVVTKFTRGEQVGDCAAIDNGEGHDAVEWDGAAWVPSQWRQSRTEHEDPDLGGEG